MAIRLTRFKSIRPPHEASQEALLDWTVKAHVAAEAFCMGWTEDSQARRDFSDNLSQRLMKIGLGPEKIERRGTLLRDPFHTDWNAAVIYRLNEMPQGVGFGKRTEFYSSELDAVFDQFYQGQETGPQHLIHVTCTGYASPSCAQKLVSRKHWTSEVVVTHAYHMGCYASLPAIRIAQGLLPADIIHTEVCSLHLNPTMHETEQLVIQSLFADGFIKYSVTMDEETPGFSILATAEEIIPDTTDSMSWYCEDWGLKMKILKDVPVKIAYALEGFISRLLQKGGKKFSKEESYFALHPGGPKVIEQIAKILHLRPDQIVHTKEVLKSFGNMSSATLPHIWEKILADSSIQVGTPIISLAYGPGLTLCGALFIKE